MNLTPFNCLNKKRLQEILTQVTHSRIAVIGDFCLDVYWIIDMSASELSVETGKRTQPVREQRYSLGGAGNVVANLSDLKVGQIHPFAVIGDDPFGIKMVSLLKEKSNCEHVLTSPTDSWQTLAYCKPYIGEEELQRIDMGNFNHLSDELTDELIDRLEQNLSQFDVVIINQQVKSGIHTVYFQTKMADFVANHQETIFIYDGRHVQGKYDGVWLKINDYEALRLCGIERDARATVQKEEVLQAMDTIFKMTGKPFVVTRGAHGCIICTAEGFVEIPGIKVSGKIDPVGAGDSFLAGLAASLATGANLEEAAQIGNYVAAVTIKKIGQTGTANPQEVLDVADRAAYTGV